MANTTCRLATSLFTSTGDPAAFARRWGIIHDTDGDMHVLYGSGIESVFDTDDLPDEGADFDAELAELLAAGQTIVMRYTLSERGWPWRTTWNVLTADGPINTITWERNGTMDGDAIRTAIDDLGKAADAIAAGAGTYTPDRASSETAAAS